MILTRRRAVSMMLSSRLASRLIVSSPFSILLPGTYLGAILLMAQRNLSHHPSDYVSTGTSPGRRDAPSYPSSDVCMYIHTECIYQYKRYVMRMADLRDVLPGTMGKDARAFSSNILDVWCMYACTPEIHTKRSWSEAACDIATNSSSEEQKHMVRRVSLHITAVIVMAGWEVHISRLQTANHYCMDVLYVSACLPPHDTRSNRLHIHNPTNM